MGFGTNRSQHPLARDLEEILGLTQALWGGLRGARLFITGGTGFFGSWLLNSFAWANREFGLGARATVLSRDPAAFLARCPELSGDVEDGSIAFHPGDVRSFEFPAGGFSHVIAGATAASAHLNESDPRGMVSTIVEGTRRTLEFAEQAGATRILFVSSGGVYGRQPTDVTHIEEDYVGAPDPMAPGSAYGEAKRLAEFLCAEHARRTGQVAVIARCFAFVGPRLPLDAHFAIGNFIRDALSEPAIRVGGDGSPLRSYLYSSDLVVWLWTLLLRGQTCRPYHVGSEDAVSIAGLAHAVAESIPPGKPIRIAKTPLPGNTPERYVPSTRRAREELGLRQTIGLHEAIRRTAAWNGKGKTAC